MAPRHSRDDDDARASVSPLRLVDREPPEDDFSPEVRAVLDAVAALHMAVIGWAAATVPDEPPSPTHGAGRHRR